MANHYPEDTIPKLEFNLILDELKQHISSELGLVQFTRISFSNDLSEISAELALVEASKNMLDHNIRFTFPHFYDLQKTLDFLKLENAVLPQEELFRIYLFTSSFNQITGQIRKTNSFAEALTEYISECTTDSKIETYFSLIFDDDGEIKDSASPGLQKIRKAIKESEQKIDRHFESVLQQCRNNNWLSTEEQSVRRGERVLALQSQFKRKIKGIIVDESSTSKTIFLQPESILELLNRLFEYKQAEKREVYIILRKATEFLQPFREDLLLWQFYGGRLDILQAKALYARQIHAVRPRITSEGILDIIQGYHPVLLMKNSARGKKTIPLDLLLDQKNRILVISGPNAGGKTVCLKTIGLFQLMLQAGLLLPLEAQSTMHPFEKLFIDIGDNQSINDDLSTYSGRLELMKHFLEHANNDTLFLIDEFGTGTDPAIGGIIAETALGALNRKKCYGIVTTHYHNLKTFASAHEGLINGSMTFDREKLRPEYILQTGKPGSSYTYEVVQSIGFKKTFLDAIREHIHAGQLDYDKLLSDLQQERTELTRLKSELESKEKALDLLMAENKEKSQEISRQKKDILTASRTKAEAYINNINREFEKLVKKWQEEKNEEVKVEKSKVIRERIHVEKQRINKVLEKPAVQKEAQPHDFTTGDYVCFEGSDETGQIMEMSKDGSSAEIAFGNTRIKSRTDRLIFVKRGKKEQQIEIKTTLQKKEGLFFPILDVRGMRRDEALQATEKFLESALLYNISSLKIIHGYGDGILKQAIREYIRKCDFIASFKGESFEFGGEGVTLVEMK